MNAADKNRYLVELSASAHTDFGRIAFIDQKEEQKVFSSIWALESEVNSGGFAHFFASGEGDTANFAPAALRRIGAAECAAIVERALSEVSPRELPADFDERGELLRCISAESSERLAALDSEFFKYPNDLTSLLYDFVVIQPEVFALGL